MHETKLTENDMTLFVNLLNEDKDPNKALTFAVNLYNNAKRELAKSWREKDGRPIHDGDCHFWSKEICTCGLIHHLLIQTPEDEWYAKEWGMNERQMDRVPEPLPGPTEEEMKKREKECEKLMDKIFNKVERKTEDDSNDQ